MVASIFVEWRQGAAQNRRPASADFYFSAFCTPSQKVMRACTACRAAAWASASFAVSQFAFHERCPSGMEGANEPAMHSN